MPSTLYQADCREVVLTECFSCAAFLLQNRRRNEMESTKQIASDSAGANQMLSPPNVRASMNRHPACKIKPRPADKMMEAWGHSTAVKNPLIRMFEPKNA